jgi:DNA-binding PadR family transcriptional regulator
MEQKSRASPLAPPPVVELPGTAWAVLGLLSFGRELSGYDLKKWADSSLRFFYWAPAVSQIYAELKRLERVGFVTSRTTAQDELRNKRVYAITPAGRDAITEWVQHAPVEPPVLKHGVAMRVWLGHLADPAQLRAVVEQHRDYASRMLLELEQSESKARLDSRWAYPELVIRWGERYYRAEVDLAERMLEDLDDLSGNASYSRSRAPSRASARSSSSANRAGRTKRSERRRTS